MTFRVSILSPLKATEADVARRQRRYSERASAGTQVTVLNLRQGPPALNTSGDILESASAIYHENRALTAEGADAILIDCVFDPAVEELREATGVPVFGPTRVTLPVLALVAPTFSIVARSQRQCELMADLVERYGYGRSLRSLRALGISYEEAKQPEVFEAAMTEQLRRVSQEDRSEAVMFGSTTMALSPAMVAAAEGIPLFMPGMVALRVIEHLWQDGLWPARREPAHAAASVDGPSHTMRRGQS